MTTRAEAPALVVPAAGRGTRLNADRPKFLVPVSGRPMIARLLEMYSPYVSRIVVIVGPGWAGAACDALQAGTDRPWNVVVQPEPTGMLDAVLLAHPAIAASSCARVWITWCDQVAIEPQTIALLATAPPDAALVMPTVRRRDPYVHFDRDDEGRICGVRQRREGDAMPEIGEGDTGLFSFSRAAYLTDLAKYAGLQVQGAVTGERNLLPFIPRLAARARVDTYPCADPMEAVGINTPEDLAAVEAFLSTRTLA